MFLGIGAEKNRHSNQKGRKEVGKDLIETSDTAVRVMVSLETINFSQNQSDFDSKPAEELQKMFGPGKFATIELFILNSWFYLGCRAVALVLHHVLSEFYQFEDLQMV